MTDRNPGRIGPWRLLDLMHATMPWRASLMGGGGVLPELGPADAVAPVLDPDQELPGSNIGEGEQRLAIERERARRFVRPSVGVRRRPTE